MFRWSRQDRLAVLVIAITVGFLIGAILLVMAAGTQTTAIAAEYDSPATLTYHSSVADARGAASPNAVVLPVTRARDSDGREAVVIGIANGTDVTVGRNDITLRGADGGTTLGTIDTAQTMDLTGPEATVSIDVRPRKPTASIAPPSWYATDAGIVKQLEPTGAFVLHPAASNVDAERNGGTMASVLGSETAPPGIPLLSALAFFLAGTRQALTVLVVVVAGSAVLIAVTVFNVTRMSVRDRRKTIRVIRSTGGSPARVLGLFGLRALLLTGVGVAMGYALGVIIPNAAVNLAVAVGLPTSLSVEVTRRFVQILMPAMLGILIVGVIAGLIAAWPAVSRPPARLTQSVAQTHPVDGRAEVGRLADLKAMMRPTVLGWRALVPSAATLTVFTVFVLFVAGLASMGGLLMGADGAMVTEPDSAHPISSQVPEGYATVLHSRGIAASPEIVLFEVINGEPIPARGANYEAFANVTEARLIEGRAPTASNEVVIGTDLARTLGMSVGDTLTLGGSNRPGMARVTVVGTFKAAGPFDDQLVVPLATARHLSTRGPGEVNLIRAERLPEGTQVDAGQSVRVVNLNISDTVVANRQFETDITVRNSEPEERTVTVYTTFRDQRKRVELTVPPMSGRTVTVTFAAGSTGTAQLRAGTAPPTANETQTVNVVDPDSITIKGIPDRAPPGSAPRLQVVNATGSPVANATVTIGTRTGTTNRDGNVRIPLGEPGERTIEARHGDSVATTTAVVAANATRRPTVTLDVSPPHPSLLVRPTVRATVANPWNQTRTWNITITGPGDAQTRDVRLAAGAQKTVEMQMARQPPGTYPVHVQTENGTLASTQYTVSGDDRIVSAIATSGRSGTTAFGQAIEVAFGNIKILLAAMLGLAGLMTIGGTTATFAQAVHARRRTLGIHRVTGADPRAILHLVLSDALRVGAAATVLALGLGYGILRFLDAAGILVVFGIRLTPTVTPPIIAATAVGALALTLLGAGLATIGLLREPPARLIAGRRAGDQQHENGRPPEQTRASRLRGHDTPMADRQSRNDSGGRDG